MTEFESNIDDDWRLFRQEPNEPPPDLTLELIVSRDGPAECTIFPDGHSPREETGAWVRAKEGSFISLEDVE